MYSRNFAGLVVAALVALIAGCGGDKVASTPSEDQRQTSGVAAEAESDIGSTGPVVVDEDIAGADADDVAYQLAPTTNLHVAAFQRAYVAAIQDGREEKQFAAAVAVNDAAEQEEVKRKAGGAATASGTTATSAAGANGATSGASAAGGIGATTAPSPATAVEGTGAAASSPVASGVYAAASATPPPVDESAILADPHGQWAITAEASSYYGGDTSPKPLYGAIQATGAPNVPTYSDSPLSWTTKSGDSPTPEWITLTYATPVHATAVKIRQSAAPGVISKIELMEPAGAPHVLWEGIDNVVYPRNTIAWLIRELPRTDYVVSTIRITLQTNRVWGWNEIDAIQLVGEP